MSCTSLEIRKLNVCFQFTRIMYVINCNSIARNTLLLISYFFTVSVKKEKCKYSDCKHKVLLLDARPQKQSIENQKDRK